MKKYYYWLEVIMIAIIVLYGLYTLSYKISLTTKAQKDRATISKMEIQLQKGILEILPLKNEFGGDFLVEKRSFTQSEVKGVTITSTNIPYQACLRYGLEAQGLAAMAINDKIIYRYGDMPNRDKILEACLLEAKHSNIKMLVK